MASITLKGNPVETAGSLPAVGSTAPDFTLVAKDLSDVSLSDFSGQKVVLNIFPSLDIGICAAAVRRFNAEAANLPGTVVLCISADQAHDFRPLPVAQIEQPAGWEVEASHGSHLGDQGKLPVPAEKGEPRAGVPPSRRNADWRRKDLFLGQEVAEPVAAEGFSARAENGDHFAAAKTGIHVPLNDVLAVVGDVGPVWWPTPVNVPALPSLLQPILGLLPQREAFAFTPTDLQNKPLVGRPVFFPGRAPLIGPCRPAAEGGR